MQHGCRPLNLQEEAALEPYLFQKLFGLRFTGLVANITQGSPWPQAGLGGDTPLTCCHDRFRFVLTIDLRVLQGRESCFQCIPMLAKGQKGKE